MTIELSNYEIYSAGVVGLRRRIDSIDRKLKGKFGFNGDTWSTDIDGALGELAVAKMFNVYWDAGVGTFKAPDVDRFQVRSTKLPNGCLIIRDNDNEDSIFILVTGEPPILTVAGWIKAEDGKLDKWKRAPNGRSESWFVPRTALHPMEELLHRHD